MWRPLILAASLAAPGGSSELPSPGPGFPADVRSVRLFEATLGSLTVSLRFLDDGSVKTFGPFECLVH